MNSEKLISEAADAIYDFVQQNDRTCILLIKNGSVIAIPTDEATCKVNSVLYITPWQQINGLTANKWNLVASELMNLYNKEKACQAHQKP